MIGKSLLKNFNKIDFQQFKINSLQKPFFTNLLFKLPKIAKYDFLEIFLVYKSKLSLTCRT